jgi:hypothetical protein
VNPKIFSRTLLIIDSYGFGVFDQHLRKFVEILRKIRKMLNKFWFHCD